MTYLTLFLLSYTLGSFPTAYLVVKQVTGKDIRQEGTGNVGAMNTARATGKWYLFLFVTFTDALKGAIAVSLSYILSKNIDLSTALMVTSFGVILGHCYSIYFKVKDGKFAGGKAIASLVGVLWVLSFSHLLLPWFLAMTIPILITGNLFLGQFCGTLALPLIGFFLAPQYFIISVIIAVPVFIKQWPRVIPMLQGKEPKWYWGKKKKI